MRFQKASRMLRCWLALSLALAPALPVLASPSATGNLAVHHVATPVDSVKAVHGCHDQSRSDCTQHDQCQGSCCSACAHCVGMTLRGSTPDAGHQSVLTPRIPQLDSFALVALRERPPRTFSC